MTFTDDIADRITFPEWEALLITIEAALQHTVREHVPGFEPLADELLELEAEIATEVLPSWV
jgi:hypothetical protein